MKFNSFELNWLDSSNCFQPIIFFTTEPMRQFVIDDLSPMENDNIDSYLKRNLKQSPMVGVYWLPIPHEQLTDIQKEHSECGPYYASVEIDRHGVRFEMLIRSAANFHCPCIAYASQKQRQFILEFIDTMIKEELIKA